MRLSYRDEHILADTFSRGRTMAGSILLAFSFDLWNLARGMFPIELDVFFMISGVAFLIWGVFGGIVKSNREKNDRKDRIDGLPYVEGIITDGYSRVRAKEYNENQRYNRNNSHYFWIWEIDWYAVVEYYDEVDGVYARHEVGGLNKNPRRFVNKKVKVYYDTCGHRYVKF